nr:immunoglobulin heavy chain junction region [Mus musculus]
CTSGYWFAYW